MSKPTIVIALPFDDFIEEHFNNYVVVAIALIVYGVLFIVETIIKAESRSTQVWKIYLSQTAFLIGCFQCFSVIPGTSRSVYHHWRNPGWYFRTVAAEFSLLPWNPGYVRSQPSEDCEIWFWIYRTWRC